MASEPANPLAAGDTAELYRAAIGPRGQDYYLRQFTRFDAAGKTGASWHWPAYWSTLNWLIYRKMWGQALAYLAVVLGMALLVFGVGKLLLDYADTTGLLLFLLLLTAAFVVPGLYANAWYYNFCNEKISAALRATQDVKEACALLAEQASSNKRFLGQASVNVALMAMLAGLVTFLFNPTQDLMQLAQGQADKPLAPLLPEMAAGTQPVLAPAPVARPELTAMAPQAEAPQAMPDEAAKPASPDTSKPAAAPAEPTKVDAASTEAVPPALAGLTSDVKIEAYLARLAPPTPASEANAAVDAGRAETPTVAQKGKTVEPAPVAKVAVALPAASRPVQVAAASADQTVRPKAAPSRAPQAEPAAADAGADKPKAGAKRSKAKKSWYVQAGAFAQEGNAQNVRLRIEAAGLETSTAPYETQAGRLIRVRVGPFTAKADAEKAALQVKALDLPAVLFKE
jgi:cell division septation protein DedD